jgi:arylsulfatase A-like enzyme
VTDPDRPNIVLVTYDSLRADHCGFMGYERDTTPTMDTMAEEGIVFENAVASGVPTIASMTAVMTGRHSLASPEIGFDTEQRAQLTTRPTIAEVLSDAGYATGALSPNPPASSYFGFDEGFDWFEDFLAEDDGVVERAWNRVFQNSIEGGSLSTGLRLFKNVATKDEVLRPWEAFYEDLLAWRQRVEEPYFLWVLLLDPHHPWVPPAADQRWSARRDKYLAFRQYLEMFTNGWEPEFSPAEHQRLVDLYDDSIRYSDRFLRQLRDDLTEDNPVFVVHADHGEEFGEDGRYGHQPFLTEQLVDVPLVVAGPGVDDRRVSDPVGLRDLAPTIADLAGAEHPFAERSLLDDRRRRTCVTSKVFAAGQRRLAMCADGVRATSRDGTLELDGAGELSASDELRDLFGALAIQETRLEAHQRAVTAVADDAAKEGRS